MMESRPDPGPAAIIVMGVSGSGKSTLARRLAEALAVPFLEGDEYHPLSNVKKMAASIALDDDDRWPWLYSLGKAIGTAVARYGRVVATCSSLKLAYRERLRQSVGAPVLFIWLQADAALIGSRISTRSGHFFPPSLLASQLAALEPPDPSEGALCLDSAEPIETLLTAVKTAVADRRESIRYRLT